MSTFTATTFRAANPKLKGKAFDVSGFGKISKASIGRAPFTVICGKNNSGKSYLAYLIWSYYSIGDRVILETISDMKAPKWFSDLVKEASNADAPCTTKVASSKIQRSVNAWINDNRPKIASKLLNYKNASLADFKVYFENDVYLSIGHKIENHPVEFNKFSITPNNSWKISINENDPSEEESVVSLSSLSERGLYTPTNSLFQAVVRASITHGNSASSPVYIPASRSGLILALNYISESLFRSLARGHTKLNEETTSSALSLPVADFIQKIVSTQLDSPGLSSPSAAALEREILRGKIGKRQKDGATTFDYTPDGHHCALPVHTASSMVTELTPIVNFLERSRFHNALIIEEPEAHLHLGAQRAMARALVKAANAGTPIIVTTHSDTFLQQINFLIRASKNKESRHRATELGYNDDELLSPSDVLAYEVSSDDTSSTVNKINIGEFGIISNSLSDVIWKLTEESMKI